MFEKHCYIKEEVKLKRVLFVASIATHIKTFHLPLIKMLQEREYEVEAACAVDVKLDIPPVVWDIPFVRSPYNKSNVKAYYMLRQLIKDRHYNLVHVHTPVASFLTRFAARDIDVPVLYTAHGFHFYQGAPLTNWLLYYTAERIAAKWTTGLIVMNEEDFEAGKKLGFKEGESLYYIHGVGVDLNKYKKKG